jgi:parallel beta-helix repeat protein
MKTIHLLLILTLFCIYTNAIAATYFVSNSGSDLNSGLSLPNAFLTLQKAADTVIAGDSVMVENGTYAGFDIRNKNGTPADPIIFQALGNSALINLSGPIRDDGINIENADYITIDGFIVNNMTGNGNGIRVVLSDHCIVRNCQCDNNAERGIFTGFTDDILIEYNVCSNSIDEHGIYVSNSSDRPIIRYNECFGNNNIGIHMNGDLSAGGDGIISDAEVYGNVIHDNNLAAGINMDGVEDPVVYNNLIYNNHFAQGIALFQQDGAVMTSGAKIYNNTIIVPSDGRWGILLQNGANVNTEIYNNIILNLHTWRGCISAENTSQLVSDHNILHDKMSNNGDGSTITFAQWQALGLDGNSQLAGSLPSIFEDPGSDDYHIASSSQAIDAGSSSVSTLVSVDLDGNARPEGTAYDIGAYEYAGTVLATTLSSLSGKIVEDRVILSWVSGNEISLSHYELQRSGSNYSWETVFEVKTLGRGFNYEVYDPVPLSPVSYYRLKSIELDGRPVFSNIIHFNIPDEVISTRVYPVPSKGLFNIKSARKIEKAEVLDYHGHIVFLKEGLYIEYLDLDNLPAGNYILVLYSELSITKHPVSIY